VAELAPDVVCLQEVTVKAAPLWQHAFETLGLAYTAHPEPWSRDEVRKRRLAVLTAAREPFQSCALFFSEPPRKDAVSVLVKRGDEAGHVDGR